MKNTHSQTWRKALSATLVLSLSAFASGCGKGRKIPGLESFHFEVLKRRLYLGFVATKLRWDAGLSVPIPGLTDATVSVSPDLNSDGTVFQFSVGIDALINQITGPLPLSGLPDGRPLPDVFGGQLPRWDADVKDLRLSVYLSSDAFALFVPLDLTNQEGVTLPYMISGRIEDERGNLIGKVYAIPKHVSENEGESTSGLLVLLPFVSNETAGPQP